MKKPAHTDKNDSELLRLVKKRKPKNLADSVELLLQSGTSIEARSEALEIAVGKNYPRTRELLLRAGVTQSAREAALLTAINIKIDDLADSVEIILKSGPIDIKTRQQALIVAMEKGYPRTTGYLLRIGMTQEIRDTVLLTVINNQPRIKELPSAVRAVLESGETGIEARDAALQITAERDYPNTRAILLGQTITQDARNKALLTIIEREVENLPQSVKQILDSGPTSAMARWEALQIAAKRNYRYTTKTLLLHNETVEDQDSRPVIKALPAPNSLPALPEANTPSRLANTFYIKRTASEILRDHRALSGATNSNPAASRRLIKILQTKDAKLADALVAIMAGADINALTDSDRTPCDLAPNEEIRHYLRSKGALTFKERAHRLRELEAEYQELVGEPISVRPATRHQRAVSSHFPT